MDMLRDGFTMMEALVYQYIYTQLKSVDTDMVLKWIGQKDIANHLYTTKKTITNTITRLKNKKVISIIRRGKRNYYTIENSKYIIQ